MLLSNGTNFVKRSFHQKIVPSLVIRKIYRVEIKPMRFRGPHSLFEIFYVHRDLIAILAFWRTWNCNSILSTQFESLTAQSHSCQSACKKVSKNWGGNFNLACAVIIIAMPKQLLYPTMASRVRNSFDWHRKRFLEESIFQNVDMSSWANFNGQLSLAYPVILSHRFWNLHL